MSSLLERFRSDVLRLQGDLSPALLQSLSDASDQVVLASLEVHASLSREEPHFQHFMARRGLALDACTLGACEGPRPHHVLRGLGRCSLSAGMRGVCAPVAFPSLSATPH